MYKHIKRFILFLIPIVRKAAVQVAADEITKLAYPERRPRRNYVNAYPPVERNGQPHIPRPRKAPGTDGFHDVLMVAFDLSGNSAQEVHEWLHDNMPVADRSYGEMDEIHLDSWWVANDERFDLSDNDSAVFVRKGNQTAARKLLRQHNLLG